MPNRLAQHPDRDAISAEAHARPPMPIPTKDAEAWHWVLHGQTDDDTTWPDIFDQTKSHQVIELPDGVLRYERHTEFSSLTFFGERAPSPETLEIVSACPGLQLAGSRVVISEEVNEESLFGSARRFGGEALFPGIVVSTDFQISDNGLVVYAVSGAFDDRFSRGRLVKRLLDLETYRMASLLALPLIRRLTPELRQLEARAIEATNAVSRNSTALNGAIDQLASLLKDTAKLKSETSYRIAASYAYDEIVEARLDSLNEQPIGQRQTLKGFVQHRLAPGIKSISAFQRRLDDVATSVSDSLALARTQLEHVTQQQSQDLLASMEKRARQQVHLSQAVEGLSVAAITYYLVGLFGTAVDTLPHFGVSSDILKAISIPVIAAVVWWNVRRAKSLIDSI